MLAWIALDPRGARDWLEGDGLALELVIARLALTDFPADAPLDLALGDPIWRLRSPVRRPPRLGVLALITLLSLASPRQEAPAMAATPPARSARTWLSRPVSILVVDAASGRPLAGVRISEADRMLTETGPGGRAALPDGAITGKVLVFSRPGYRPYLLPFFALRAVDLVAMVPSAEPVPLLAPRAARQAPVPRVAPRHPRAPGRRMPGKARIVLERRASSGERGYRVGPGDSLWAIARRELGSGALWPALWQANRFRIADPRRIHPGQRLRLPAIARYRVRPGDSLWAIAQDRLGAGERWPEIWRLNRGRVSDPGLIYPGQMLAIPSGPSR